MLGRKNIHKKLNYDNLKIVQVDFLPLYFDNDIMFVLPQIATSTSHSKAKSVDGMVKHYDGHVWIKT